MGERIRDILLGIFLTVALTIGLAVATIVLAVFSGIDPRNDFWGGGLSTIGVLIVPAFGWPAGMFWIWSELWSNPESRNRK